MAETGKFYGVDVKSAYAHSFGLMGDQTRYVDPVAENDSREELKSIYSRGYEVAHKALATTSGGAGTAGYALVPVYVDSRIIDRSRKFTPWVEIIPRVSNMGMSADYNIITAKGSAFAASEDAAMNERNDTESRQTKRIKFLYSVGRVTGPMHAAMPSYMVQGLEPAGAGTFSASFGSPMANDAKQYEVLKKSRSLKELEENLLWNGSESSSFVGGNEDGTEFDGIRTQQSTTNQTNKSSSALEWADVEDTVQKAFDGSGRPTIAGCDSSSMVDLRKIMIDTFRIRPADMGMEVAFGIKARVSIETMVGPTAVIPSQYLNNTTGNKSIYFLDLEAIEMRVLQDMSYEDLAKANDSQKFMLKIYETMVLKAPQFNAFISNIA